MMTAPLRAFSRSHAISLAGISTCFSIVFSLSGEAISSLKPVYHKVKQKATSKQLFFIYFLANALGGGDHSRWSPLNKCSPSAASAPAQKMVVRLVLVYLRKSSLGLRSPSGTAGEGGIPPCAHELKLTPSPKGLGLSRLSGRRIGRLPRHYLS